MMHHSGLLIAQLLLAKLHHLAALIGLGAGVVAMAVPKQSLGHRRIGRIALVAMAALVGLALVLLATYLLPDNPSRGRGPQLLLYLLVLAWMAAYSLLAGFRWASPRRGYPIPAWDITLAMVAVTGALVSLLGLVWDLRTPPRYAPSLMMGPFGSELTFVLMGAAFLWFGAADLNVLRHTQLSNEERITKHVIRLTMGVYALVVGVILVNVAPRLFPGQDHPGAYLFALAAPALLFVPANALLLHQVSLQAQNRG